MGWCVSTGDFASYVSNGTNEATGHPADSGEKLANRQAGQAKSAWLGGFEAVFALASGPSFQLVIDLMSDSAGFFNRLFHGKNKAGDGLIGQVIETDFFQGNRTDSITTSGFAEVGMAFPCMNENDGNLWGVAISLPNHLCCGAELFRGTGDGGSGA